MKNRIRKNTKKPMLAALLCVALMMLSLFLPYVTAEEEYREMLEVIEQDPSLSLYDLAASDLDNNDASMVKILAIFTGLAVIAAVTAYYRKPLLLLTASLLTTAWSVMIHLIFSSGVRGYVMSIGNRLIFAACAGLLISAVWMETWVIRTRKKAARRKARQQKTQTAAA